MHSGVLVSKLVTLTHLCLVSWCWYVHHYEDADFVHFGLFLRSVLDIHKLGQQKVDHALSNRKWTMRCQTESGPCVVKQKVDHALSNRKWTMCCQTEIGYEVAFSPRARNYISSNSGKSVVLLIIRFVLQVCYMQTNVANFSRFNQSTETAHSCWLCRYFHQHELLNHLIHRTQVKNLSYSKYTHHKSIVTDVKTDVSRNT